MAAEGEYREVAGLMLALEKKVAVPSSDMEAGQIETRPPTEEDRHGQVYRIGRAFAKLHDGNRGAIGQEAATELDAILELQEEVEGWLREESKAHGIIKKLATASGMGVIRTAQVVAIVMTPDRFRTLRQFWNYCGFGVVTRSSADWVNHNGKWIRAQTIQTCGLKWRPQKQAMPPRSTD